MKRFCFLLVFLLFLLGCKIKVTPPACYYKAKEAFENKDYELVIDLLEDAKIPVSQKTDWYYYFYGTSLYRISKAQTRKAIDNLKIAITFHDEVFEYYFNIAQMYFDIADYEHAHAFFEKAATLYKDSNKTEPYNVYLWIALTLCKQNLFNVSEFAKVYPIDESLYLKDFCTQISANSFSEQYIDNISNAENLTVDEKILIIDALFNRVSGGKEICKRMIEQDIDDNLIKFFYSKLVYYSLDNLELCKTLFQNTSSEIIEDVFILNCNNLTVLQFYNKYLCFYLYKKGDVANAVNALFAYQVAKYKPLNYSHTASDDNRLILNEFKDDEEFDRIK